MERRVERRRRDIRGCGGARGARAPTDDDIAAPRLCKWRARRSAKRASSDRRRRPPRASSAAGRDQMGASTTKCSARHFDRFPRVVAHPRAATSAQGNNIQDGGTVAQASQGQRRRRHGFISGAECPQDEEPEWRIVLPQDAPDAPRMHQTSRSSAAPHAPQRVALPLELLTRKPAVHNADSNVRCPTGGCRCAPRGFPAVPSTGD